MSEQKRKYLSREGNENNFKTKVELWPNHNVHIYLQNIDYQLLVTQNIDQVLVTQRLFGTVCLVAATTTLRVSLYKKL